MIKRSRVVWTLICVGLLAAAAVQAEEADTMTPLDIPMIGDIEMLGVGESAPKFQLSDIEGDSVDFSGGSSDKVYMLVFWSIFCEPCKAEMPLIQRLFETYRDKGLEVMAIAMDGEPMKKSIEGLVRQQDYTFRVFIDRLAEDESFVVADPYGVAGTPTIYVINSEGKVVFAEVGQVSKQTLENVIESTLAAK